MCCGKPASDHGCVCCDHIESYRNYDKIFVMPKRVARNFELSKVRQWRTLPPVINEFRNGVKEELIFVIRDGDINVEEEMQRRQIFEENIVETEIEIPRAILDLEDPNDEQQILHDNIRTRVDDVVPLTEHFQRRPYDFDV